MRRIILESPFADDEDEVIVANVVYARASLRDSLSRASPGASSPRPASSIPIAVSARVCLRGPRPRPMPESRRIPHRIRLRGARCLTRWNCRLSLAIGLRPVAGLLPYAKNARTHSEAEIAQLCTSIREYGFTNPVLVDGADGTIVAGHARAITAAQLGLLEVPTSRISRPRNAAPIS